MARFKVPLIALDTLHVGVAAQNGLEIIIADRQLSLSARKLGVRCKFNK